MFRGILSGVGKSMNGHSDTTCSLDLPASADTPSLRYDVAARTGIYPRGLTQLRQSLEGHPGQALVAAYEHLRRHKFAGDCAQVLSQTSTVASHLLAC